MKLMQDSPEAATFRTLGIATIFCVAFYAYGVLAFTFLPWKLFLAWLLLGVIMLLTRALNDLELPCT